MITARFTRLLAGASFLAICPGAAIAQIQQDASTVSDDTATTIDELDSGVALSTNPRPDDGVIIVTANRREESLQDVPIAISAFDQADLDAQGLDSIDDFVLKIPSFSVQAPSGIVWTVLRGAGNQNPTAGGDNGVAFHYDGVYIGYATGALADIYDVERVEVLRGPQGTLYGRNSTGGSINIIPARPESEFDIFGDVTIGNYDLFRGRAVINPGRWGPLSTRLAVTATDRGGYQENIFANAPREEHDNLESWSARFTADLELGADALFGLTVFASEQRGALSAPIRLGDAFSPTYAPFVPNPKLTDPRTVRKDNPEDADYDTFGITGRLDWDFGPFTWRTIAAYYDIDRTTLSDWDGSEISIFDNFSEDLNKQYSVETQLISPDTGPFRWIFGAYFFNQDSVNNVLNPLFRDTPGGGGFLVFDGSTFESTHFSIFGQGTYDLTDQLSLTIGGRYSWDQKENIGRNINPIPDFTAPFLTLNQSPEFTGGFDESWDAPMGTVVLDYTLTDRNSIYASISRGYKAGAFQPYDVPPPFGTGTIADPEYALSYEIGSRNEFFDRALTLNITAFYVEYEDIQSFIFPSGGIANIITNVGDAEAYGIEVDFSANLNDYFTLSGAVGWIHSEYRNGINSANVGIAGNPVQNNTGNQLINTPEFSGAIGISYDNDFSFGNINIRGDLSYRSRTYFTLFEEDANSQAPFVKLDARIAYTTPDDRWQFEIFGQNLTDEDYFQTLLVPGNLAGTDALAYYAAPRTFGIRLGFRY